MERTMEIDTSGDVDRSGDDIDAKGIFGFRFRKSKEKNVEVTLLGSIESNEYIMNYPKKGKCYIFNHKEFARNTGLNVRNGTDADAARLYIRFKELGFNTQLFTDLPVREVKNKLLEAREENDDYSCFVCCILSHGEQGMLYAYDGKYSTDEIVFAPFRGDVCPSLVGKPKMFFIQACQGDKLDHGVVVKCKSKESFDSGSQFRLPTHADFLIVYSTVSGFYSWRNTTNGSWFIQALCAALYEHAKTKDLLKILTIVNRRVAFDFESFTPTDKSMHLKKQVPLITSTLTRDVKLS